AGFSAARELDREGVETLTRESMGMLADAQVFFASRGEFELLPPLRMELAKSGGARVAVGVLAAPQECDALTLFFEQLGWLELAEPNVIVLSAAGTSPASAQLAKLQEWDERAGKRLPVLVAQRGAQAVIPAALAQDRRWA